MRRIFMTHLTCDNIYVLERFVFQYCFLNRIASYNECLFLADINSRKLHNAPLTERESPKTTIGQILTDS